VACQTNLGNDAEVKRYQTVGSISVTTATAEEIEMQISEKRDKTISRIFRCLLVLSIAVMVLGRFASAGHADEYTGAKSPSAAAAKFPPLSARLPFDVDEDKVRELVSKGEVTEAHRLFGILGWQTFIALNWPATDNGEPDLKAGISDNKTWRVWNYWRSAGSLFKKDGEAPAPWKDILQKPERLRAFANRPHVNGMTNERDNFEAFTGPLVDQNGKWARYEIRLDKEEFDYIVENQLYSQDGQVKFSQKEKDNEVKLPKNDGNKHGTIEIKLAWKEMGNNDDPSRFYTTDLDITPSEPNTPPKTIHVGLVGMHIAMLTKSSPEWIWSTFEQIDNVRSNPEPNGKMSHPNFVDPSYSGTDFNKLPPKNAKKDDAGNLSPASGADATTWIESLTTTPVQVKRVVVPVTARLNPWDDKLGAVTKELNGEVQALLGAKQSVFQYYEMIDVQWPLHPNAPLVPGGEGSAPESLRFKTPGEMIPTFLVNTTMETYFQVGDQPAGGSEQDNRLKVPGSLLSDEGKSVAGDPGGNALTDSTKVFATESCVGCHYSAGITTRFLTNDDGTEALKDGYPIAIMGENANFGNDANAEFSWMLQQEPWAKPRPSNPSAK
jgi:hypothetical protein